MLATHPYNTWPLHVKLFTDEAVKCWTELSQAKKTAKTAFVPLPPLPVQFTTSIELEGVDGKSGNPGSGRIGPICVIDGKEGLPHYLSLNNLISLPL